MAQPIPANVPVGSVERPARTLSYQAYQILHFGFVVLPLLAGLDKFAHILVNWDKYLAPIVVRVTTVPAHTLMYIGGALEIIVAIIVLVKPKVGAYLVAIWLAGIIINLLLVPGYYDIALRDFGLFLGAMALGRLSQAEERGEMGLARMGEVR